MSPSHVGRLSHISPLQIPTSCYRALWERAGKDGSSTCVPDILEDLQTSGVWGMNKQVSILSKSLSNKKKV